MSKPAQTIGAAWGIGILLIVIITCAMFGWYPKSDTPAPVPGVEFPDCDKDDRSPHWEVKDCGPSPLPVKTASQKKPSAKPRTTRR